jgi:hypothetical protein
MKFEMLFPEVANLFGDPFNVRYLARSVPECEVIKTGLNETPRFMTGDVDLIYMGPMPEYAQELAIDRLRPCKDRIDELIGKGTVFLITGNALEIFGRAIENEDGSRIECLGLFDTVAKRKMMKRYNGLFLGSFENMKITGFKTQFAHSYGENGEGLFKVVRGDGLAPGAEFEGFKRNNFFATYLVGPLLILNPEFAGYILKLLGTDSKPAFNDVAMEAYRERLGEFERPNTEYYS